MKKNNKGFSLVELIVVIAIMAILAAVAVVSFSIYIQKAQEARDLEYESNVNYFAQLAATEHQFTLDDVELEDVVDGPEDIKLIIVVDGETVTVTYEDEEYRDIIQEIYNGVGDYTFSDAHDHTTCSVIETKESTCTTSGYIKYSCGKEEKLPVDPESHLWGAKTEAGDTGVEFAECTECGVTGRFETVDGLPSVSIVPKNED